MAPHYAPRGEYKFTQTYMFQMGNEGWSVPQITTDMLTAPRRATKERHGQGANLTAAWPPSLSGNTLRASAFGVVGKLIHL